MDNQLNSPIHKGQYEDRGHTTQLQTIFHFLHQNVATVSMVSIATGIPPRNVCRYKRDLEKANRLWEIDKRPCEKTGHKAWYLTTDPEKAPSRFITAKSLG